MKDDPLGRKGRVRDRRRRLHNSSGRWRDASLVKAGTSVYENLKKEGITLPEITAPMAAFVPHVHTDNLVFVSGRVAKKDGKLWIGKLGEQLTTEQGNEVARGNCGWSHRNIDLRGRGPSV